MKRMNFVKIQRIPEQIARIGTAVSLLVLMIGLVCILCGEPTVYIGKELAKTSIVLFAEALAGAFAFKMTAERQG